MRLRDSFASIDIFAFLAGVPIALVSGWMVAEPAYASEQERYFMRISDLSVTKPQPAMLGIDLTIGGSEAALLRPDTEFSQLYAQNNTRKKDTIFVTYEVIRPPSDGLEIEAISTTGAIGMPEVTAVPTITDQAALPPLCGPSGLSPSEIADLVVETARKHRIDENLALAIAFIESGFDRQRNSPKGARGVMQLMPETAARFGVSDVCDPRANIAGGAQYLRVLQDEFRNPLLVAAAYNAGEARIYQYGGIPPFAETIGYVAKVINYQLGLDITPMHKPEPARTLPHHVDEIAPKTGVLPILKGREFTGGVMHF